MLILGRATREAIFPERLDAPIGDLDELDAAVAKEAVGAARKVLVVVGLPVPRRDPKLARSASRISRRLERPACYSRDRARSSTGPLA